MGSDIISGVGPGTGLLFEIDPVLLDIKRLDSGEKMIFFNMRIISFFEQNRVYLLLYQKFLRLHVFHS